MKNISKKSLSFILVLVLTINVFNILLIRVNAVTEQKITAKSGINKSFNLKLHNYSGKDKNVKMVGQSGNKSKQSSQLPSSYSSVDKGYVTNVKDQGKYGMCWAFAANAASESSLIKNNGYSKYNSFSPVHTTYWTFSTSYDRLGMLNGDYVLLENTTPYQHGGNGNAAIYTFARGMGPANENRLQFDTYAGKNLDKSLSYPLNNGAQLKTAFAVPVQDRDNMKKMIMQYGAGVFSYYDDDSNKYIRYGYDSNIGRYASYAYNPISKKDMPDTNHSVTVVGWDDNFSANNFAKDCNITQNGAWLIKNSWGVNAGVQGYYWISYQDFVSYYSTSYFYEYETKSTYDNIYQYDGTCYSGAISNFGDSCVANVYTSDSEEILKAVSFFTDDSNVKYEVNVYRLNNNDDITSATNNPPVASAKGVTGYEKYITVPLDKQTTFQTGDKYVVAVKYFGYASIPIDLNIRYTNSSNERTTYVNSIASETSFINIDDSWIDVTTIGNISVDDDDYDNVGNFSFRIKALTDEVHRKGDVNLDGKINIKDATTIQMYKANMINLTQEQMSQADVNCDGTVNNDDATLIQLFLANYILKFSTYTVEYSQFPAYYSGSTQSQTITQGFNAKLQTNPTKRSGYTFGWYLNKTDKNYLYVYYTNGTSTDWYLYGHQPEGYMPKLITASDSVKDLTNIDNGHIKACGAWVKNSYTSTAVLKSLPDKTIRINNKNDKFTNSQALGVGSAYLYAVKPDSDKKNAIMYKTNKSTGKQVLMKHLRNGRKYDYITGIGYANDMSVASINNKTALFIATNDTPSYSVVRLSVDGDTLTTTGNFNLYYNGKKICPSGIAKYGHSNGSVHFFFTSGNTVYKASIPDNKSSGSINLTRVCYLNKTQVMVNGVMSNVYSYGIQGIYYNNVNGGTLYVPITKGNTALIITYQGFNHASGTMYANSPLSFFVQGASGTDLNVQACGMSSDGILYFDVNRPNNGDAIMYFKDYKA